MCELPSALEMPTSGKFCHYNQFSVTENFIIFYYFQTKNKYKYWGRGRRSLASQTEVTRRLNVAHGPPVAHPCLICLGIDDGFHLTLVLGSYFQINHSDWLQVVPHIVLFSFWSFWWLPSQPGCFPYKFPVLFGPVRCNNIPLSESDAGVGLEQ